MGIGANRLASVRRTAWFAVAALDLLGMLADPTSWQIDVREAIFTEAKGGRS